MLRAVGALVAALVIATVAVLVHLGEDVMRGSPIEEVAGGAPDRTPPPLSSPAFLQVASTLLGVPLAPGHQVEILEDTEVFDVMLRDIRAATRSITFAIYYCEPGHLGDRFAEALAERARAGVKVLFLGDGYSCNDLIKDIRPRLEATGAQVVSHRPVRLATLYRAQHRNHSRMVVIDGTIGYTGGFGLDDRWSGEDGPDPPWRDTSVRFLGPAVRELQAGFLRAWAEATGTLEAGSAFFPVETLAALPGASPSPVHADVTAGMLYSGPTLSTTPAERFIALTVSGAQRTLWITNSYFVPTALMERLLLDAAHRGVDVRLLLPGRRNDVPSTRWAGRGFYQELLVAGVRIFEYRETMMHAKTTVADGIWSSIGTMNLDNRSTRLNDESTLLIYDAEVGASLDSIFLADVAHADEVSLEEHRSRPKLDRFLERVTRVFAPLL